jgi:hypothetical protein
VKIPTPTELDTIALTSKISSEVPSVEFVLERAFRDALTKGIVHDQKGLWDNPSFTVPMCRALSSNGWVRGIHWEFVETDSGVNLMFLRNKAHQ